MSPKKAHNPKRYIVIIALLLVVAGCLAYYFAKDYHRYKNMAPKTASSNTPIRGATSKPIQHSVSTTPTSTSNPGGTVNENGQTPSALPPSTDWVSSSSGAVTLQLPTENTVIKNGDTISGTAKVSSVNYVLSDTSVGQISQGTLSVVNGRFSGKMEFTAHSSNGTLQVYYSNPSTGAEEDLVEINVNF